jgi:cob(I)alamin adenosyltransferase
VYTGRGDKGETSLFGSRRVSKDSPLVDAYGTIDELNSYLGIVIADSKDKSIRFSLEEIQKMLFTAGADAATEFRDNSRVPRITPADTLQIEKMTKKLLSDLPALNSFILPGGTHTAAQVQFARAVCRRAERRLVTASKAEPLNPELIRFFNRLSSYLFNLSRGVNQAARKRERPWKGGTS